MPPRCAPPSAARARARRRAGPRTFTSTTRSASSSDARAAVPTNDARGVVDGDADLEVGGERAHRHDPRRVREIERERADLDRFVCRKRAATSSSNSARRAISTRFMPRRASASANAAPRPSEAPATTAQRPYRSRNDCVTRSEHTTMRIRPQRGIDRVDPTPLPRSARRARPRRSASGHPQRRRPARP